MDSDEDDCLLFPNVNVVQSEPRKLYRPPFDLVDFEEQIMCVDGKLDRVALLERKEDHELNDREEKLDFMYSALLKAGKQLLQGEYVAILESSIAQTIISQKSTNLSVDSETVAKKNNNVAEGDNSEGAAPVHDSDVNLVRRSASVNVLVLKEASRLRTFAAHYIVHGLDSNGGTDNCDSDSEEDEDLEDWLEDVKAKERAVRSVLVMIVGAAALNSFVQQNWTGPPQTFSSSAIWIGGANATTLGSSILAERRQNVRLGLEVEGDHAFYKCELPELLLLSRALLSLVSDGGKDLNSAAWTYREDVQLNAEEAAALLDDKDAAALSKTCSQVGTTSWWAVRAAIIHHRTLIYDVEGNAPLRSTVDSLFAKLRRRYSAARIQACRDRVAEIEKEVGNSGSRSDVSGAGDMVRDAEKACEMSRRLVAQVELEYGLTRHQWGAVDDAKENFHAAKVATGLDTHLTGFRGRKTKYQIHDTQHLVVVATSELKEVHEKYVVPELNEPEPLPLLPEEKEQGVPKSAEKALGMSDSVDKPGEKEALPQTGGEGISDTGAVDEEEEEDHPEQTAAYASSGIVAYTLDEVDPDNIVLENIRFTDENYDQGGILTLFDQCVILSLCLDVKNSNSKHGLTNLEMAPYVTRVMETSQHSNWMVHTSALLVRAWLEFEVWRTKTRAMMQLQALVDQHVNRLSAGQRAGTDFYAPALQRMRYVYVLPLQSYWEMRGDLADRYMALHIKHSALALYTDLERWEQIVQCYLDLEQDKKALSLVKERLELHPTPMLYCSLGELENNDEHFRTAWKLSGKRYARALRLLAQRRSRNGDSDAALECYLESTSASPNNHACWWRIGSLAMRKERWKLAVNAWTNVARLAPQDGEARANLGAVFTRLNMWEQAYRSFDMASQLEFRNWKVWENKLFAAARTGRYADAILSQRRVVDLRGKRKDHKMNWRVATIVTNMITMSMQKTAEEVRPMATQRSSGPNDEENGLNTSDIEEDVVPEGDEDDADQVDATVDPCASNKQDQDGDSLREDLDYTDADGLPAARHAVRLQAMFEHASTIVEQDPEFWALYQQLEDAFGNSEKALDCGERRFRALERGNWEENEEATLRIADAAENLSSRYKAIGKSSKAKFITKMVMDRLKARSSRVAEAADNVEEKWREDVIERLAKY